MHYRAQTQSNRPVAIAGVLVVHAALAALVLIGLHAEGQRQIFTGPMPAKSWRDPPPPPPPGPKPKKSPKARTAQPKAPTAPPPRPAVRQKLALALDPVPLPPGEGIIDLALPESGAITLASPFDPIAARPRGNPARWVSDSDYKPRWAREGLEGTAHFRLDIAANGRVSDCQITRSSGHAVLDEATCALISRRARFDPARDGEGRRVPGSYQSMIRWVLPD